MSMDLRAFVGTKREVEIDTTQIRKIMGQLGDGRYGSNVIDWDDPDMSWLSDTIVALCDCIDENHKLKTKVMFPCAFKGCNNSADDDNFWCHSHRLENRNRDHKRRP